MNEIIAGDAIQIMQKFPSNSIDTKITDPPYGLGFFGKAWDAGVPRIAFWSEMLRVAKPGAIALVFGGTRTWHRLACVIEDSWWGEVKDTILWLYGQGMPKGEDVSKAVDKAFHDMVGVEKQQVKVATNHSREGGRTPRHFATNYKFAKYRDVTPLVTDVAKQWVGWRSDLRPAWEPILVFMKERIGTFGQNAIAHGIAGMHVDACMAENSNGEPPRLPANLVHDDSDEVMELFSHYRDASGGSPARFFYTAKAGAEERWFFCPECVGAFAHEETPLHIHGHVDGGGKPDWSHLVYHPTVKPLALMEYLCRLTETPTKGIVLDPFCGSGSTCVAAKAVGRPYIGIDSSRQYIAIAKARVDAG